MAVYKRTYKPYTGPRTKTTWRWLILTRYSYARMLQSKLLAIFLALCLFYPFACLAYIYLSHNLSFLAMIAVRPGQPLPITGQFFYYFCFLQGGLAILLTAIIGPNLISPDLVNGAMPLYFCRPFSRLEYVAGKITVLLVLLSLITWIPGLFLYSIEGTVAGWDWFTANLWMAEGVFVGLFTWIVLLSLIALASSAWVKWKIAAGAMVLGVFFAGAGFANAINGVMRTTFGSLIDLSEMAHTIWSDMLRYDNGATIPTSYAWFVLIAAGVICAALLLKRIRPFEVVK
jgi:ABC-2 type transport system permease protein